LSFGKQVYPYEIIEYGKREYYLFDTLHHLSLSIKFVFLYYFFVKLVFHSFENEKKT